MYWQLYSEIKTARFTIPKTPKDLRICDHWNLNSVENKKRAMIWFRLFLLKSTNEIHYLQITIPIIMSVFFSTILTRTLALTANYVFQAFERRKKHNFYTIQLYWYFLKFILLYFDPEMVILKNKLVIVVLVN